MGQIISTAVQMSTTNGDVPLSTRYSATATGNLSCRPITRPARMPGRLIITWQSTLTWR